MLVIPGLRGLSEPWTAEVQWGLPFFVLCELAIREKSMETVHSVKQNSSQVLSFSLDDIILKEDRAGYMLATLQ